MPSDSGETPSNELTFSTPVGLKPIHRVGAPVFRIAILGDFSGRANRGVLSTHDEITETKPIRVDFDSLDEVLGKMSPQLRIPIAGGRSFVNFEFRSLADFHPDHLFEVVPLIDSVAAIERGIGRSFEKSVARFSAWSDSPLLTAPAVSPRGINIPVVEQYSEFSEVSSYPTLPSTATQAADAELLQALCAPHLLPVIRKSPVNQEKLAAAAREATNAAVREFMHHPDFQAVEGAWQELDWLLRRTSRSANIEVVLFDVSAEEFAADLGADRELQETGLYRLLVEKTAEGIHPEPWSAIVGRYHFDFSSSHAQLLGRISSIAQRLQAPFLSGFTNKLLDPDLKIRDKELVAAWTQMRSAPESSYLGLALPGFLLRLPYGKNGKSVEKFLFEEFSPRSGSRGFLWGNSGTFCAAMLAGAYMKDHSFKFDPNNSRVLDRMPVFALQLPNGDSVTFCSEKQFPASTAQQTASLGLIPLQAMRGRDSIVASEIRSLHLKAPALCGPWAPAAAIPASSPSPGTSAPAAAPRPAAPPEEKTSSENSGLDPELAALLGEMSQPRADNKPAENNSELDPELAALLGEMSSNNSMPGSTETNSSDELDPELAALLGMVNSSSTQTSDSAPADGASELDPELAALLGATSSAGDSPSSPNSSSAEDDEGLDPELAALLKG